MLIEVHTGTRPGRARLLLFIAAGTLVGALGLAWWQVRVRRVLGPEQRIADTPLIVRLPKGWIADSGNPQAFVLPVPTPERWLPTRTQGWRRAALEFERRIRFDYAQLPRYESTERLLRELDLDPRQTRPARIGPHDAVEVTEVTPRRFLGRNVEMETIVRFTCLPGGQLIKISYDSLFEMRPADLDILDEVCRTVRLDERALQDQTPRGLRRAGRTPGSTSNGHVDDADVSTGPELHAVPPPPETGRATGRRQPARRPN